MSEITKIQWCDHTFNPWIGCTKVSPGCANCYAEKSTRARVLRSQGQETWGRGAQRDRTSESNWKEPLKWNRKAEGAAVRPRVFCASLSDWLDDEVPIEWLADLLKLVHDTPNLDWLLLTKRPQNWLNRIHAAAGALAERPASECWEALRFVCSWNNGAPPANVWVGTTVEDQARADLRIPQLLGIPARVRFLSCEPLLESVNLQLGKSDGEPSATEPLRERGNLLHWVIVGGESGPQSRPFLTNWADSLVSQCAAAGVACFVKQMGARVFEDVASDRRHVHFDDKKGGEMHEWPEGLRVREFPTA
jgi:protein gp37